MKLSQWVTKAGAIALVSMSAACATWNDMDRTEKGTATGATGGALVGAAVGGPIGAVVGAGVGGYAGYHETQPGGIASGTPDQSGSSASRSSSTMANATGPMDAMTSDSGLVRSLQQALNARGYNAGQIDGQWGTTTQEALRQFQQANGFAQTGRPDDRTLAALGVSR